MVTFLGSCMIGRSTTALAFHSAVGAATLAPHQIAQSDARALPPWPSHSFSGSRRRCVLDPSRYLELAPRRRLHSQTMTVCGCLDCGISMGRTRALETTAGARPCTWPPAPITRRYAGGVCTAHMHVSVHLCAMERNDAFISAVSGEMRSLVLVATAPAPLYLPRDLVTVRG